MSEVEAVQEAYRGKELTTARKRIREATSFADLEKAETSMSILTLISPFPKIFILDFFDLTNPKPKSVL